MKGLAISKGIAIGKVVYFDNAMPEVKAVAVADAAAEVARLKEHLTKLKEALTQRLNEAEAKGQKEKKEIFEAHAMIVDDPELSDQMIDIIKGEQINAEHAVQVVCNQFVEIFQAMDNEYLKQRANDIMDIRDQLIKSLMGIDSHVSYPPNTIVMARDFNPSDIHLTEDTNVIGLVAEVGAETTHFAILAKISGIPTVLAVEKLFEGVSEGDTVIVDGDKGELVVNPEASVIEAYKLRQEKHAAFAKKVSVYKDQPTLTKDGKAFGTFANVANIKDLKFASANGAEGIGLFRTEFIYMERSNEPSESEQFDIYKQMVEGMQGKPTVIRTLDVGGDKELSYLGIPKEDNPFLGFRAVRYCLTNIPLFKTQIRALLRASVYGDLYVMVPMISNLEEVLVTKKIFKEVEEELKAAGTPIAPYKLGIMIEVPSAAFFSDVLAEHVDFFSIGTNDLIQYTMAADRMNKAVSYLYSPYMPALVRLLNTVITNGNAKGIHVAMCGELASNPRFIPLLIGMGLHEFSMSANRILESRYIFSKLTVADCEALRDQVLKLTTEAEVKEALEAFYQTHLYEA